MRKTLHRWFWSWEHEKEEQWLNSMADQGWGLVAVGFATYHFDSCGKGEYAYRIELLDRNKDSVESQSYLEFLEEANIQVVGNFVNWVYFRKKKLDGPFELFSDIASQIKHYQRIYKMMMPIGLLNFYFGLLNLRNAFKYDMDLHFLSGLNLLLALLLFFGCFQVKKKINKLKKEQKIYE